ncbi:MAG: hypothetical protein KGJ06_06050 [Pseudomonadota bacterium]|nr:hypothetical protein [Pseudomonadota bacterium]
MIESSNQSKTRIEAATQLLHKGGLVQAIASVSCGRLTTEEFEQAMKVYEKTLSWPERIERGIGRLLGK